jgi:DNA polymerase III subunit alpha
MPDAPAIHPACVDPNCADCNTALPSSLAQSLAQSLPPRPTRFAHLHQHTQYSLLDGAARLKDLLKWVKGQSDSPALAMTDHGNMHGTVQFYKYALELGVKPILGYEAYVAAGSRFDRRQDKGAEALDGGHYHLTLLAKNFKGYQNLCRLASIAYLEGYYYKPRIDREVLALYREGIIVLSGCLGAEVPNMILHDRLPEAEARLQWYLDVFGKDYYVEIQNHGLPEQTKVNAVLREWANKHGIGMVATNDGHYVKADDAYAHETLLAIQTKAAMSDEKRFRFPCNEFYVKSLDEMRQALPLSEWGDEIFANSYSIAEQCNVELPIGNKRVYQMPQLPIPEGRTMAEELRVQVYQGTIQRYPADANAELYRRYVVASLEHLSDAERQGLLARLGGFEAASASTEQLILAMAMLGSLWLERSIVANDKYTQYPALDLLENSESQRWGHGLVLLRRAEYESGVIIRMGFPDYFLIVADFINWAKDHDITVGPGRGSGAGSLVAYTLRITNLDPLAYGLLFERFLNPDRVSMPDFDVDFSDSRRQEVIDYVRNKYGDEKVAMIATFGTMASKAVFKDVARVMNLPYADADKVSKLIPVKFGRSISLEDSFAAVPDIKQYLDGSEEARKVFDIALRLEGLTRHASIHASGVIIGRERLDTLVPLMRDKDGDGVVCQYDMSSVEDIGLIKMDFLGLRTLSFLEEAVKIVRQSRGISLKPDDFPIDDEKAYKLLSDGKTKGVFQLEGGGISDASRKLKPRRIQDIIALSALYRPGPMENIPTYIERHHGREAVRYDQGLFNFPASGQLLEPILRETYGIPVYQEQIMQIASAVAGYSLGQADLFRRAIGKKKVDEMAKERIKFVEGSEKTNAVPEEESNRLFDMLESFANYGFNKCLAAATQVVDCQTGQRIPIIDIVEGRATNVMVTALCEHNLQLLAKPVIAAFPSGEAMLYRLKTETGRVIEATANHPFYTTKGWRPLERLVADDFLAIPRVLSHQASFSLQQHQLVLLGYVLSEGNLCHPSGFYAYAKLEDEISDYVTHLERFENTVAVVDRSKSAAAIYAKRQDRRFESQALVFLRDLGVMGLNALNKHVPEPIFTLSKEQIAVFLGRLWTGDGGLQPGTRLIHYATSSEQLAKDVQHLLLRLGLMSRIHAKTFQYRGGQRFGYSVHVLGGMNAAKDFAALIGPHLVGKRQRDMQLLLASHAELTDIRSSKDVIPNDFLPAIQAEVKDAAQMAGIPYGAFVESLGFRSGDALLKVKSKGRGLTHHTAHILAQQLHTPMLELHTNAAVYWDQVVSIEAIGVQPVYDLTVEGAHNFVANDFIVHNSHSAAYAFLSYQTAYIKANYPVEFMASLLTVERRDSDKVAEYINDARGIKLDSGAFIEVLSPDINRSDTDFKVVGEQILFGLFAVKSLGDGAVEQILENRRQKGAFKSLADFCSRLHGAINRRGFENLIKAGALDHFGNRESLLASLEDALAYAAGQVQMQQQGMDSLFGMATVAPEPKLKLFTPPKDEIEARVRAIARLKEEKEAVGLYISGHPLEHYPGMLEAASCKVSEIEVWFHNNYHNGSSSSNGNGNNNGRNRRRAVLAGMISGTTRKPTKSGGMMARFNLTDDRGGIELVAFSRAYDKINDKLGEDIPALVVVEIEPDGETLRVLAEEVVTYDEAREVSRVMYGEINLDEVNQADLEHFDEVLHSQAGVQNLPIRLHLRTATSYELVELDTRVNQSVLAQLQQACPWLRPRLAINGEAVLAKFVREPKPWERKGSQSAQA